MKPLFIFFKDLSKLLLLLSKIIFIMLSLYYILNNNIYTLTFNVPLSIRSFSIIDVPLKFIETIGMSFMIIPLAIVIIAFYYPDIRWLQIFSGFFSVSGNLFSVSHLINKGLLQEYFRTYFFTIYNVPSFETKKLLFSDFFNQKINSYLDKITDIRHFQCYVQDTLKAKWIDYTAALKTTPLNDINAFAFNSAESIYNSYNQQFRTILSNPISQSDSSSYKTIIFVAVGVITVVIVGYICWYFWDKLHQTAMNQEELAKEQLAATTRHIVTENANIGTDQVLLKTLENVDNISTSVRGLNTNLSLIKDHHEAVVTTVNNNATRLTEVALNLSDVQTLYNQLKETIFQIQQYPEAPLIVLQITKIQEDIVTLALGGKTLNDSQIDLYGKINAIKAELSVLKEKVMTVSEPIMASSIVSPSPLEAARVDENILNATLDREMRQGLAKIQEFDAETIIKSIKSESKRLIDDSIKTIETKADEALTQVKEIVSSKRHEVIKLRQENENLVNKLADVEKTTIDLTTSIEELKAENIDIKGKKSLVENAFSNALEKLQKEFDYFKQRYVTEEMSTVRHHLGDLQKQLNSWTASSIVTGTIRTMGLINQDNKAITTPISSTQQSQGGSLLSSARAQLLASPSPNKPPTTSIPPVQSTEDIN